jgi:hypothetical protein
MVVRQSPPPLPGSPHSVWRGAKPTPVVRWNAAEKATGSRQR